MKNLKQEYGSEDCLAYCAAMAFDVDVEKFKVFARPDVYGRYSVIDFIRFGLLKGFFVGYCFTDPEFKDDDTKLLFEFDINISPAFVIVESDYEAGEFHSIIWDGEKVLDPNPAALNKKLSDYVLKAWYPILKITN